MSRGLPFSLLVHVLFLILIAVYGNHVNRPPLENMQVIPFHLVSESVLRQPVPEVATPKVDPLATPEPQIATPPPPELSVEPPKEVPVANKEQDPPPEVSPTPEKKVEPTVDKTIPVEDEIPEDPVMTPATFATGPAVETTDTNFPFAWYLTRIEGLIDRNWNPAQLGFGKKARVTCSIHFEIGRSGLVSGAALVSSSGIGVYDRDALRAVTTTRLPPLPPQYAGARLGVTFIFNLEPGS